jgi:hypothetical protein
MTNLASLRANLTESGFELLSPSATLQIRGGGGKKNSGKKKGSNKGKKSNKSNKNNGGGHGHGYGYCPYGH